MVDIRQAAGRFLANKRIAVTGVSRSPTNHGGNVVYQRLASAATRCSRSTPTRTRSRATRATWISSRSGGVDAVVIATRPSTAEQTMRECVELGIDQGWMHRAFGAGSVSDEATAYGRDHGVTVIDGGCPLMFELCDDGGHRFMRRVFTRAGKVPKRV